METLLYSYCTGINNKVDPARLAFDAEKGMTELEAATDMLIDKSGGLAASRGNSLAYAGNFISAYPAFDETSFYAVRNSSTSSMSLLEKYIPNASGALSLTGMRSGLTVNAKMDFCTVGGNVYYMNGFEFGFLDGQKSNAWPASVWPRNTHAPFIVVTAGNHLDMLSGRFIISYDDEIRFTEQGLWGIMDANRNWRQMESRILMICTVNTGVFVSDEKSIWFLDGRDPNKWDAKKVLSYPAIEFQRYPGIIDPSQFGFETSSPAVLFGTKNGPVVGLQDGSCVNLIDKKVALPSGCSAGSIMIVDETTIILSGV